MIVITTVSLFKIIELEILNSKNEYNLSKITCISLLILLLITSSY